MSTIQTLPQDMESAVQQLMTLPPQQRLAVGERLIQSVPPTIDETSMKEYRRRLQELENGSVTGVPAHEAINTARQTLREARKKEISRRIEP